MGSSLVISYSKIIFWNFKSTVLIFYMKPNSLQHKILVLLSKLYVQYFASVMFAVCSEVVAIANPVSCLLTFAFVHVYLMVRISHYSFLPYFLNRKGSRLGHDTIVDGMMKDGLWDVYNDFGMGVCAEICADQHSITKDDQVYW